MGNATSTALLIDPMIDIDIKNGSKTVDRVLGIIYFRGSISVSHRYESDGVIKSVLFKFKKGCNENDVWEYIEDFIMKQIRENEEVIVLNNFHNRGFSYSFNKETKYKISDYIKLLVRCMMKAEILYLKR
jgi:hypothetical protein